ncbi:MAG: DUF3943 domain-containing protein [Ignavibacteriales bacterium]|nr:DUF3943 domain-containing protein [Ignavibacteriales bacterium]
MKNVYFLFIIFLISISLQAQFKLAFNEKMPLNQNLCLDKQISMNENNHFFTLARDPFKTSFPEVGYSSLYDSTKYNMYGDLLNDNPFYNEKTSLWTAALEVTLVNVTTLLIDRYLFNYDFSNVGFNSWNHNLKTGWEWDIDRFAMNHFFHPFSGSMYYNSARANGYSFFESAPFTVLGSLEWEYFGENTLPSYNDVINTTVNGIFLGEIFYRLGSNILDDQTTGADRFFREFAAAIITPSRFISRLLEGKLTRTTKEEVYQKEPLNITLSGGYHRINEGVKINKQGSNSLNFNIHLDYGNPFEKRSRKPFDYFKIRTDLDFGVGRKILNNVSGSGILFGENSKSGNFEMLVGVFQNMNFFDNKTYEIGTIAFGPGIISKLPISKSSNLYTNLHIDIMPFGGLSGRFGPDTTQVQDYNYCGGAEGRLETTLNLGGWMSISFIGYYWWFHTYVGVPGNSFVGLIKPRIAFNIFDNVSIGFEHLVYYSDRYPNDFPSVHSVRTEQKINIQIYLEEFKFKKHEQ